MIAAATWAIGVAACASHPKGPIAPASVPCGYRVVKTAAFALAVPLFWEGDAKRSKPTPRSVVRLLTVDGSVGGVILTSEDWGAGGKAWTNEVLARLKRAHFETVEQRPLPSAGEDAVLVEHRHWDSRRKTEWHDWRVLVVGGDDGFELLCRIDENDLKTLGQVCTRVAESFVVAR